METVWFWLLALMLAVYVVLDGFDLGAGILHLFVARTDDERRTVLRSVGPVWDGNEVWLVAAGGTMICVFPVLYASAFSGFYLPLMMVLWLLIGRATGIEFRNQVESPLWKPVWDFIFFASSALLALLFGVALGNVIRGVPLRSDGTFFEPLWTDFSPIRATGVLDGYTLLTGATAVAALAYHGALWLMLKTEGDLHERAYRWARRLIGPVAGLAVIVTLATVWVQPHVLHRMKSSPAGFLLGAFSAAGLVLSGVFVRRRRPLGAFLGSAAFLVGMIACAAFGIYPYVLPGSVDPGLGLTAHAAAADAYGLKVALGWWIPGVLLVAAYFAILYRHTAGKA